MKKNTPTIKKLSVLDQRYFWIKSVKSVNLNVHCARCLVGEYSNFAEFGKHEGTHKDFQIKNEAPFYYMCGVHKSNNWHRNFHLAFIYKEGSEIICHRDGVDCIIENAEQISIVENKELMSRHSNGSKRQFNTCRNWQFAIQVKEELEQNQLF